MRGTLAAGLSLNLPVSDLREVGDSHIGVAVSHHSCDRIGATRDLLAGTLARRQVFNGDDDTVLNRQLDIITGG